MKPLIGILVLSTACSASVAKNMGDDDVGPDASVAVAVDGPAGSVADGPAAGPPPSNRDRLLNSYLAYLRANPAPQTNHLAGPSLDSVCQLWTALDPSSRATFLTVTARLAGSVIDADHSVMLDHVTKLYRAVGGQDATASDPGSCGGGEYNRLIMSMDPTLQAALVQVNSTSGQAGDTTEIHDLNPGGYWRDSHDLGGPHDPFDQSDETNDGAPRGQVQYFADPNSSVANSPLGRQDLMNLVDPFALEMDEDYNCPHDSNPLCSYTTYGTWCFPEDSTMGVDLFSQNYGDYGPNWTPAGC